MDIMQKVKRLAAFSDGGQGGNPAGVLITDTMPSEHEMLDIAAALNYSETAFVVPLSADQKHWRVRYFSPKIEIPFWGHATITLTAVLGQEIGLSDFTLTLNDAVIDVEAEPNDDFPRALIKSPPTWSKPLDHEMRDLFLNLFGLEADDISPELPSALIYGGATHILLPLKDRNRLSQMHYHFDQGADLMSRYDITTVMMVCGEGNQLFYVRNAFAAGCVLEDPATGAAAAALAGYLRDINWPCNQQLIIRQGDDMGMPSIIYVTFDPEQGSPVRVSGVVRAINT